MALSFCIIAASCVKQGNNESSTEPNTTVSTTTTGTSSESTSQTTTTTTGEVIPPVAEKIYDIESEKVGDFVTVNYNADTCTVKTEVKKAWVQSRRLQLLLKCVTVLYSTAFLRTTQL